MKAQDAIANAMDTSTLVVQRYLSDLDDSDLMRRPGPGCNHLAWQLGHLIASGCSLLNLVQPGAAPPLPDGFAEQHSKATADLDDPSQFHSKQQYEQLLQGVADAAKAALAKVSESDLDQPAPENLRSMFPTTGAVWMLLATHPLMHAGQFVPVRRALGKPVVI